MELADIHPGDVIQQNGRTEKHYVFAGKNGEPCFSSLDIRTSFVLGVPYGETIEPLTEVSARVAKVVDHYGNGSKLCGNTWMNSMLHI